MSRTASGEARNSANVRRRVNSLMKKAHELKSKHARVYVVVEYGGVFQEYASIDDPGWPPTQQMIHTSYPLPMMWREGDDGQLQKHSIEAEQVAALAGGPQCDGLRCMAKAGAFCKEQGQLRPTGIVDREDGNEEELMFVVTN